MESKEMLYGFRIYVMHDEKKVEYGSIRFSSTEKRQDTIESIFKKVEELYKHNYNCTKIPQPHKKITSFVIYVHESADSTGFLCTVPLRKFIIETFEE